MLRLKFICQMHVVLYSSYEDKTKEQMHHIFNTFRICHERTCACAARCNLKKLGFFHHHHHHHSKKATKAGR